MIASTDDEDALILNYKTKVSNTRSKLVSLLESLLFKVKDETSDVVDEYDRLVPHHSSQQTRWLRQALSEDIAELRSRVKHLDAVEILVVLFTSATKHVNRRLEHGTGSTPCCVRQLFDVCPLVGHRVVPVSYTHLTLPTILRV